MSYYICTFATGCISGCFMRFLCYEQTHEKTDIIQAVASPIDPRIPSSMHIPSRTRIGRLLYTFDQENPIASSGLPIAQIVETNYA